jgi:predicted nucleic acid-binding protein
VDGRQAIRNIRADRQIITVPGAADLFSRGFELYAARAGKDWSLTGGLSFTIMADRHIDRALTADVHFVQAGSERCYGSDGSEAATAP